ncbi:MAG: helix-turn-helix transcriptional regulator [Salinivirgaceae bacterium]|nr:helix-turn-helix transcriptional regulator [Salinivirgaceae bacterium]
MMQDLYLNSVQEFNDYYGFETFHPLVSVVHFDREEPFEECMVHYGLYALFLKENKGCKMFYGRTEYDFDEMTITSFEPGQVLHVQQELYGGVRVFPRWTALVFHPDLLKRTNLGRNISRYEFFGYKSTEALHLSQQEIDVFRGVLSMIDHELHHAIDKHSRDLIVSNIELLLNYCLRFYDRQFITREEINHSVVKKFVTLLDDYLANKAEKEGLPTVAYFADKCCLSTGYFGTLVKIETERTAKDIINERMLQKAKELLQSDTLTVTQISQRLGFEYPQHFVRFFKALTGKTPTQWRAA